MLKSILLVCSILGITSGCEKQWIPFGDSCYWIGYSRASWFEVKKICNYKGGYPVRVTSQEENSWLKLQIQASVRHYVWIGGIDYMEKGNWVWESTGEPLKFCDWIKGQPHHSKDSHCTAYYKSHNRQWIDAPCLGKAFYICEKAQVPQTLNNH